MDRHIEKLESALGEYRHELNRCREENDRLQRDLRRRREQSPFKDPPSAREPDRRQTCRVQEPPGVDRDGLRSTGAGRSDLDTAAFDENHSQVSDLRPAWTREYLAELQGADPDVAIIRGWLESGVEVESNRPVTVCCCAAPRSKRMHLSGSHWFFSSSVDIQPWVCTRYCRSVTELTAGTGCGGR